MPHDDSRRLLRSTDPEWKPNTSFCASQGRTLPDASQKHWPDAAIIKIQQALKYEEGHHYVNTQGTHSDFANALVSYSCLRTVFAHA